MPEFFPLKDSHSLLYFDDQEADEYQSAEEAMDSLPDSESEGYEGELESMTGKGISRLCSELLELKKASDEDFQRNIYSNYSAFVRIFEEVGGIENEIIQMKNHISSQKMFVEELMSRFHPEIILEKFENMKDEGVEDLNLEFPSWLETRMQNILETLDILMSEHRMEETLVILEKENQALQKLPKENDCLFSIISPFACAISYWRTRLAEQFALLAGHKRVTWPELHNALFGLLRLGEGDRASNILLNFFHLQLQSRVNELKCPASSPHGTYILELTKVVFFTIIQASRSYVVLFGETSPYTPDIMQWARTELKVICHSFDMYVKSISETSLALDLTVEIMNLSFSFCSLLEHERLSLQADMVKLMKPCITELLRMHFDHLRKVVSLFAITDNWVLDKFFVFEKLTHKPSLQNINEKLEYSQVTSSGRKFITLMQMVLDDTFPFHVFHLKTSVLEGLTDLFDEYIRTLEISMTVRGHVECNFPMTTSDLKLQQQISILINSSELLYLLPTLVQNSFNSVVYASDIVLSGQDELSPSKEWDLWKLEIQEISDRLNICFCQLFVPEIMSYKNSDSMKELDTCTCGHCIRGSPEDLMPSFVFQELFMQLRHLEQQFESMLFTEDGMMNDLLNEIMMNVIFRLTENWEFLKSTKSHRQLLLDMHFLMEIARTGDYYSDNLMVATSDLMRIMELELCNKKLHHNSDITEERWASNAAKLAIKTLVEANIAESETKDNPMRDYLGNHTNDNHGDTHERIDSSKLDDEFVNSLEDSSILKTLIRSSQPLQSSSSGTIVFNYDNEKSRSPTMYNSCIEDKQAAIRTETISNRLSETMSIDEINMDDFITISAEDFSAVLGSIASPQNNRGLTDTNESESNSLENQLLGILENLDLDENLECPNGNVNVSNSIYLAGENFAQVNEPSEVLTSKIIPMLQTEDLCYDVCSGDDEMPRIEVQHSKETFSTKENDQSNRNEAKNNAKEGELKKKMMIFSKEDNHIDECQSADSDSLMRNKSEVHFGRKWWTKSAKLFQDRS